MTIKNPLHIKYFPEVDGLRALAVLSVIIFHTFPDFLAGGFIGVDIFFVISGYLISTIILKQLSKEEFSFLEFYGRRIRRIFPSLLLVLAISCIIGWPILLPIEYKNLGKYISAGAGFISNIVLWGDTGYFNKNSETQPLLHLWTLGIEEQFYIIWPFLLWLSWKYKVNYLKTTIFVALVSFFLNISKIHSDPIGTFYLPQTRLWEFLVGSILPQIVNHKNKIYNSDWLKNVSSIIGLSLLIYGFLEIDKNLEFPGKWALIPVVGAALIILAGSKSWINEKILSNKIIIWFGLISYPLYLWHWSLLSFLKILHGNTFSNQDRIISITLSIIFAWLTHKFIEKPIRFCKNKKIVNTSLIIMMLIMCIAGYSIYSKDGFKSRFDNQDNCVEDFREGTCFLRPEQKYKDFEKCVNESNKGKTILLWGDSHAAHLYLGLKAHYGNKFIIIQRTASGCPPVLDFTSFNRPHCKDVNNNVFEFIKKTHPDKIIMSAYWVNYGSSGSPIDTIKELRKIGVKNIDLFGPGPVWENGLPRQFFTSSNSIANFPERMNQGFDENFEIVDRQLRERAEKLDVRYISVRDILCNSYGCLTRLGPLMNSVINRDSDHLTKVGSEFVIEHY